MHGSSGMKLKVPTAVDAILILSTNAKVKIGMLVRRPLPAHIAWTQAITGIVRIAHVDVSVVDSYIVLAHYTLHTHNKCYRA